jgi:glycosyltransferase involved in cell wall biosynthesis
MLESLWFFRLQLLNRGALLINSIAAWPLALRLLKNRRGNAFWYIHETFDPHWVIHSESQNSAFHRYATDGRMKLLFGSEATRQFWARNGFDGEVRYWSGISKSVALASKVKPHRNNKIKGRRRVILNVGSVGGRKGTRALIEAFALGRREGLIPLDTELCIVGCPPPSGNPVARDLIRRVHKPDLHGFVRLVQNALPSVLPSYYQEADVYAHSSVFDCMPIALLTAMAHGLPIVATDADGCGEAIENGKSGYLVQPRRLRQMAEALGKLLTEPKEAQRLGAAARKRFAEKFSVETTFAPLEQTLANPVGGSS